MSIYDSLATPPVTAPSSSPGSTAPVRATIYDSLAKPVAAPAASTIYDHLEQPTILQRIGNTAVETGKNVVSALTAPPAPKSLDMQESLKAGWDTIANTLTDTSDKFQKLAIGFHPINEPLRTGVNVGEAGLAVINNLFLGVTAPLNAARGVPVVGYLADGISNLFSALGTGGADLASHAVNVLPVSNETKNTIRPLAEEVGALTAQILAGKGTSEVISKVAEKSKAITDTLHTELQGAKAAIETGPVREMIPTGGGEAENVPISTPATRHAQYLKDNGYEPYTAHDQLPTIQMGSVPRITDGLPVIKADGPVRKGSSDFTIEPIKPSAAPSKAAFIPAELQPLAEEAKKYTSAEDFVKAQTSSYSISDKGYDTVYHETSPAEAKSLVFAYGDKRGLNVSPSSDLALGQKGTGAKIEFDTKRLEGNASVPDLSGKPSKFEITNAPDRLTKDVKSVVFDKEPVGGFGNWNKEILPDGKIKYSNPDQPLTKSQLTDLYNKAHSEPAPVEKPVTRSTQTLKPIEGTGEVKARGVSQSIEASAIEKGLTDTFGNLPEYKTVNFKEQAALVSDLIAKDPATARAIALGDKAAPKGVVPEMVAVGIEKEAIANGDVQTLKELANSKLASAATTMGQRIAAYGQRDVASPVEAIKEVQDARKAAIEARGTKVEEATVKTVKALKTGFDEAKAVKVARPTWESFIESITCGY